MTESTNSIVFQDVEFKVGDKVKVILHGEQTRKNPDEPNFDNGIVVNVNGSIMIDCAVAQDREKNTGRVKGEYFSFSDDRIKAVELIVDEQPEEATE